MILIVISGLLSLGLIWAINALARSPHWGMAGACVFAAGATVLPPFLFCLFSPAFVLQSAMIFVSLLVCMAVRLKPQTVLPVSIAAMVVSYGFFLWTGIAEIRELSKLRAENPLKSVADRLRYETKAAVPSARPAEASQPLELAQAVEKRLSKMDDGFFGSKGNVRQVLLRHLHSTISDEFVLARGFGPVRTAGVRAERIELPSSPSIPLPSASDSDADDDFDYNSAAPEHAGNARPRRDSLLSMHDSGLEDAFASERLGYVKDRDHVAGFVSHQFTKMPQLGEPNDNLPVSWKIVRLELVSMLKHDVPVAYVSKNLPQMDELQDAPTRPLDLFEQHAVSRLRTDEDVMIEDAEDRIRMVGSLRAGKACLGCHSVRRGDLLGALTYELVPAKLARKRAPQISPPSS
jgi:hypothetical protein